MSDPNPSFQPRPELPAALVSSSIQGKESLELSQVLGELRVSLLESEQKFRKVLDACPEAITITDVTTGRYLDVNDQFESMFGYGREEVLGHLSSETGIWAEPEDRRRLVERLACDGRVRDFHAVGRTKDGRMLTCALAGETVDISGRPVLILLSRDITEQLNRERAMRGAMERFLKVFNVSPDAMALTELDTGRLLDVNEAFVRMYGLTREAMQGKTSTEAGLWADVTDRDRYAALVRQGAVRDLEIRGRRMDGSIMPILVSGDVFEADGRSVVVTVVRDITRQRRAEHDRNLLEAQLRRAQRLESLGTMAGGIAHDFNNILTAIMAYTDFALLDSEDPLEVQRHLQEVRKASERARDLVARILAFSRQQKQERRAVDLRLVLREVLGLVRPTLPATIEVTEQLGEEAQVVMADAGQLHQVVMNLVTNAEHAMRGRTGRLGLSVRSVPHALGRGAVSPAACIAVLDTGVGMPSEVRRRIFEPFYTTKGPAEGTGLGLAVVQGIVQDHGGTIEVDSREGEGSEFRVYLPLHFETPEAPVGAAGSMPGGKGQRILFLDDEAQICEVGYKLLTRLGYRVTTCTNPVEALATLSEEAGGFDLIVTDLTMPSLTGVDLARRVFARKPDMPVILMTGYGGTWTPERVKEVGIREFLAKPLDLGLLAGAVSRALASVPVSNR